MQGDGGSRSEREAVWHLIWRQKDVGKEWRQEDNSGTLEFELSSMKSFFLLLLFFLVGAAHS